MPRISQKVNPKFDLTQESHRMAAAILDGERKKAEEILRISDGGGIFIPGTEFATIPFIAQFYGVTESYARGIFGSRGISSTTFPKSIQRKTASRFCAEHGIPFRNHVAFPNGGREITFPFGGNIAFYDSRAVLAFACLAFMSRKIIPGSNAQRVLEIISKSDYCAESEKYKPRTLSPIPVEILPGNLQTPTAYIPVSALSEIIKAIAPYIK